jgi:hypothetical protein
MFLREEFHFVQFRPHESGINLPSFVNTDITFIKFVIIKKTNISYSETSKNISHIAFFQC